jgi:TatD DNase family protein
MNLIIDTHAHYDDDAFKKDREGVLSALPQKGVFRIINNATDLKSAQKTLELSQRFDYIFAALCIHPLNITNNSKQELFEIKTLLANKKVIAVGEIGLDYHYGTEKNAQKELFEEQLKMAKELDLPVIVHDRESHEDVMFLLEKYKPKGTVHCFSGDLKMAQKVIDLGMYISIGGFLTLQKSKYILEVAQEIPLERILLETDAPYLAPVPFRGTRCDSSMIAYTAQKLADLRQIPANDVLQQTKNNACQLFAQLSST